MSLGHYGGLIITGDPAGAARSTQTEDKTNNFTIAAKNLSTAILDPKTQILSKQPAQVTRLEFINDLFNGFEGWTIEIDLTCRRLTTDFIYQKKNEDGTKEKLKVIDPNGGKSEKYGHCSDCFDYAIVKFLNNAYDKFQHKVDVDVVTTVDCADTVYDNWNY